MKVLFYSSNSNVFNKDTYLIKTLPSWRETWNSFCKINAQNEYISFSQLPALFLPENTLICNSDDTYEFANQIESLKPDLVIALSFWTNLFDWLNIKDALIAEELKNRGLNVICHSLHTSLICFDKYQTHNFLVQNGFLKAKAFFIDHNLYFCGGNRKEVKYNIYKEAIINQICKMKFPLIIKDPVSLSSYGMDVLKTKGEVINYLNSKKNNSSRLIEEFIDGENYGVEVYSYKNKDGTFTCNIFPPFIFSTNKYGITSPKQSIKCGPVNLSDDLINDLNNQITKLVSLLQLEGPSQIDLILSKNKWYFVEINPRLSGMTTSYCASLNISFYSMINSIFVEKKAYTKKDFSPVLNIKIPILIDEQLIELKKEDGIYLLNQINNLEAKQEREKGYCEVILNAKNKDDLLESLLKLQKKFPSYFDENFFLKAQQLIKKIK